MARPALKEEDKRVVQVNIRLTEAEHDRVNAYAEAAGITPANWIRQKVFTGKFPAIRVSPLNAAVYRELHKIGVNLNQAVKAMHTGKQPNLITIIGSLLNQQKEIIKRLIP
ncbi:plasmid mobilization relaxosome protein MobC [Mucilaginibacter sp. 14171R-50]|uniref:plasmid mobilization protein n=1 Tax=Mucilaginibacter sp. 14171R-50 TaxID=2703789 RepID=UPI00138C9B98|nr:plasmid mobilization relaxosome protein MobC [Mucilaginibacter sp. 14171R-50]QHS56814.1 plasmid mobilization relaxosome protein MobC [Mucilaginibacter sp. 14171R-50]